MSLFDKLTAATEARDVSAYADLMADDFTFIRHKDGSSMNKAETTAMLTKMMANGGTMGARRKLYENDDVLVVHSINDYPDGTREAVLAAYKVKDGKITRLETGATPL